MYAFQANNICITKTVPNWTFQNAAFEMQHESAMSHRKGPVWSISHCRGLMEGPMGSINFIIKFVWCNIYTFWVMNLTKSKFILKMFPKECRWPFLLKFFSRGNNEGPKRSTEIRIGQISGHLLGQIIEKESGWQHLVGFSTSCL